MRGTIQPGPPNTSVTGIVSGSFGKLHRQSPSPSQLPTRAAASFLSGIAEDGAYWHAIPQGLKETTLGVRRPSAPAAEATVKNVSPRAVFKL